MSTRIFDAAVSGEADFRDFGYLFRGTHYYKYNWRDPLGVMDGYPQPIAKYWKKLPDPDWHKGIDAAINGGGRFSGMVLFFRGDRYQPFSWIKDVGVGRPEETRMLGITGEFQSGIDAAIEGHGQFEGKALFFREGNGHT